jgi:hypothetical protein
MGNYNFIEFLESLRRGGVLVDLAVKASELVGAIKETEKNGSLTLTLSMKPDGHGRVFVTDDIKVKIPELKKAESILFVTEDNWLQRKDPLQMDLPFKDVDNKKGELKDAIDGGGEKPALRSVAGGAGK